VSPESILISLLFAVAAVAFIGVLNARGVWRTVVASLLALFCLGAAVFHAVRHDAVSREEPGPAPAAVAEPDPMPMEQGLGYEGGNEVDLRTLLASTRSLRDSLVLEDPTKARALTDSAYQAFENRTQAYLVQARRLRESAAGLAAAPPPGLEEAAEYLNLGLQPLVAAATDLNRFFHASSKDEERRLVDSFRRNAQDADTPLRQAESRLGGIPGESESGSN
jgi:hypothetical protein